MPFSVERRIMGDGKEESNLLTVVIQHLLSIGIFPTASRTRGC